MTAFEHLDLRREIEGMKKDQSQMIGLHLEFKDRRYPCTAWKEMADRMKARIERMEEWLK